MDIKQVHIGMKLRNSLAGRTGEVTKIEREGGLELVGNGLTWNEHVENVEPVGEFHVGDRVRQIGPSVCGLVKHMGEVGAIEFAYDDGRFLCVWDSGNDNAMWPASIEHVDELRIGDYVRATGKSTTFEENVEGKIGIIDSFMHDAEGDLCADIRWLCGSSNLVKVAQLTPCGEHFYCDDDIRDFKSLIEVAKCYIQVEPEELLLSQDAKRVVESLRSFDCPICMIDLIDYLDGIMLGSSVLDGLIEAREAGRIRLDDGKYSIIGVGTNGL